MDTPFLQRFFPRVLLTGEPGAETARKALLLFMVGLTLLLTVGWTILHYALGAYRVGFNLVLYFGFNAVALAVLLGTRRFWVPGVLHVGSFFVLPWTATLMEGTFEDAGFIAAWSAIPVFELSLYAGWRAAAGLVAGHALLAVLMALGQGAGVIDRAWFNFVDPGSHDPPGERARLAFYVINLAGTCGVALALHVLGHALGLGKRPGR